MFSKQVDLTYDKERENKGKELRKKKQKKEKTIKVKKVAEEQEIWNNKEEAERSEKEAKKLIPE